MDRSTGRLYVGAVNHLYDLSPEGLAIREHALTGPRADSVLCAGIFKFEKFFDCKKKLKGKETNRFF